MWRSAVVTAGGVRVEGPPHPAAAAETCQGKKKSSVCDFLFPQHYILAFGGIIAIPLILAEPLCIKDNNLAKSQLISTIFFVSGLCTLLQTTVGTR